MNARSVAPRTSGGRYEPDGYRVDFWRPLTKPIPEEPDLGVTYEADEWEVDGARDVNEVLLWAESQATGRTFTVYAIHRDPERRRLLLRLYGTDPTVTLDDE